MNRSFPWTAPYCPQFLLLLSMVACGQNADVSVFPSDLNSPSQPASDSNSIVDGQEGQPPIEAPPKTPNTSSDGLTWWTPKPAQTWVWDLDSATISSPSISRGAAVVDYKADVYAIDPINVGAQTIATLHRDGKKVVCYVDVGSWEPGRSDRASFDAACICGAGVSMKSDGTCSTNKHKMTGWNEWWFDIHTPKCAENVRAGILKRFESAQKFGCDAIEPDNLDAWQNEDATGAASAGWSISIADQVSYLKNLAQDAHNLGMGILLKNAGGLIVDDEGKATSYTQDIVNSFDGSLNEQCHQYDECSTYAAFSKANKAMWNAEYLEGSSTSACSSTSHKANFCGTAGMKTLQYSCLSVAAKNLAYVCP